MSHRAICRLAEVAALGVLEVRSSGEQGDLHVRDLRANKDAAVPLLLQVCHDQALPVDCQHIGSAAVLKYKAAPRHTGLQQQMHLRIVAQRLKVPDAFHSPGYGLLVDDRRIAEIHAKPQTLPDHALKDLLLHLPHDLGCDLFFLLIIAQMQGRILFFQNREVLICFEQVFAGRQDHFAAQYRLQKLFFAL